MTGSNFRLLLDTHVWLRYGNSSSPFRRAAIDAIDEGLESGAVYVSVISIWEIALLVRQNKLALHVSVERWVDDALAVSGLQLLPLSPQIAIESVNLPEPMHKDPADRILVASARVERLTLVTADKAVLKFAKTTGLAYMRA
jgi:PIN domain nuclease of toxin-antitoxin system